jgi:hypothetical protein
VYWLASEVSSSGTLGPWEEIAQYATPANERTITAGPNAVYSFGGNAFIDNNASLVTVTEHLVVQESGAFDCP